MWRPIKDGRFAFSKGKLRLTMQGASVAAWSKPGADYGKVLRIAQHATASIDLHTTPAELLPKEIQVSGGGWVGGGLGRLPASLPA